MVALLPDNRNPIYLSAQKFKTEKLNKNLKSV